MPLIQILYSGKFRTITAVNIFSNLSFIWCEVFWNQIVNQTCRRHVPTLDGSHQFDKFLCGLCASACVNSAKGKDFVFVWFHRFEVTPKSWTQNFWGAVHKLVGMGVFYVFMTSRSYFYHSLIASLPQLHIVANTLVIRYFILRVIKFEA